MTYGGWQSIKQVIQHWNHKLKVKLGYLSGTVQH